MRHTRLDDKYSLPHGYHHFACLVSNYRLHVSVDQIHPCRCNVHFLLAACQRQLCPRFISAHVLTPHPHRVGLKASFIIATPSRQTLPQWKSLSSRSACGFGLCCRMPVQLGAENCPLSIKHTMIQFLQILMAPFCVMGSFFNTDSKYYFFCNCFKVSQRALRRSCSESSLYPLLLLIYKRGGSLVTLIDKLFIPLPGFKLAFCLSSQLVTAILCTYIAPSILGSQCCNMVKSMSLAYRLLVGSSYSLLLLEFAGFATLDIMPY